MRPQLPWPVLGQWPGAARRRTVNIPGMSSPAVLSVLMAAKTAKLVTLLKEISLKASQQQDLLKSALLETSSKEALANLYSKDFESSHFPFLDAKFEKDKLAQIQYFVDEARRATRKQRIENFFKEHQEIRSVGSKNERHILSKQKLLDEGDPLHRALLSLLRKDEDGDEFLGRIRMKSDEVSLDDLLQSFQGLSKVDQWISSLQIEKLVSSAFVPLLETDGDRDKLLAVARCSEEDLILVSLGIFGGLVSLLKDSVRDLRTCKDLEQRHQKTSMNEISDHKFMTMSCGPVSAFYQGLGDRVGGYSFEHR